MPAPVPSRRERLRRVLLATLVVAASAAVAPLVAPATAQALPSGAGWSASWDYYTATSYQFKADLPGVKLVGYGTDNNGQRTALGTIRDTADDGMCARVLIYATGVGYIADEKACIEGATKTFSYQAGFDDSLLVVIQHSYPSSTSYEEATHMWIPSSKNDPTLRTVGTGMFWKYLNTSAYEFGIQRPGVRLDGDGQHQPNDLRSALTSVWATGNYTCARMELKTWNNSGTGSACNGGYDSVMGWSWEGWIDIEVCSRPMMAVIGQPILWKCIDMLIPEPF